MRLISLRLLVVALLVFTHLARAQDWPQWRGPTRDGVLPASYLPAAWPDSLQQVWRVELGEGYASPVVADGRVFVHARRDPEEYVFALDFTSGKILWQQKYAATFEKNRYARRMAKGPNATPLIMGARLITLGMTGVLTAWESATGRLLWRNDYSKTVDTSKLFCGTSASPLALDESVVVQVGSDVHGGQILALDPKDGKAKWQWHGHGPGYASPVVFDIAGTRQIVTLTDSSVIGLDATNGGQLWEVPFLDDWHENIVTPVWTGSHLIVSGTRQGTHAYTMQRHEGEWQVVEAWQSSELAMYMSSPVTDGGVIYAHAAKQKGQFVAFEAKTGAIRWTSTGREGWHASVLLAPEHLILLTNIGELVVARRNAAAFEIERRYQVAQGETFAMPVLLGEDMVVRDVAGLASWSSIR